LALKRRRTSLQKVTSINQVFRNSDAGLTNSTTPDLGLASTGIEPEKLGKGGNPRVLPAITGLPLPPTPGQGSSNESTASSDDHSQRKLCKKSTATTTTSVSQSFRDQTTSTMPRYHGKGGGRTNTKRTQSARIGLIEKAKMPVVSKMNPIKDYHQHSD